MPSLDKLINMLSSPKSSTRYDACEELRVSNQSSEEVIFALEKATMDTDPLVADAARNALEAEVHFTKLLSMDRISPIAQEIKTRLERETQKYKERLEREAKLSTAFNEMLITTTPTIEGIQIEKYLGIVTSEVVLGTGFFSELEGAISDTFGVRAELFQGKLKEAKETAILEIKNSALNLGADAIVGIDLDYSVLRNNMLMLVVNGTAVRLTRE